jgi:hypothetical protein
LLVAEEKSAINAKEAVVALGKRGGIPRQDQAIARMSDLDKAKRMFEMRLQGLSLMAIASVFNCSSAYVHGVLEKYKRNELLPYVEDYRQMQRDRAEMLWQKLIESGKLEKGDPAAFNAGVNILKRMAANDGSDAPTQIELTGKVDPKEIELHTMILEAKREARRQIKAIQGSVEPEEDDDTEEDLDD